MTEQKNTFNEEPHGEDGDFMHSVTAFCARDIGTDLAAEKKRRAKRLLLPSACIALCIAVLCYSAYMIAARIVEDHEQDNLYKDIRPDIQTAVTRPVTLREPNALPTLGELMNADGEYQDYTGDTGYTESADRLLAYSAAFKKFKKQYPDAYAWIYLAGLTSFTIDYPVMKGETNDTYLRHNFKLQAATAGAIFAEASQDDDYYTNFNSVLYGHCMRNGSMFRSLKTWFESRNRNSAGEAARMEIYTENCMYVYKMFSAYRENGSYFTKNNFSSTSEYLDYLKTIDGKSKLDFHSDYNADSRICTLVTCANVDADKSQRYVVHWILERVVPY